MSDDVFWWRARFFVDMVWRVFGLICAILIGPSASLLRVRVQKRHHLLTLVQCMTVIGPALSRSKLLVFFISVLKHVNTRVIFLLFLFEIHLNR